MNERLHNVMIGDIIRVFTYRGTELRGHVQIPYIVDENRHGDEIFEPLNLDEDGLRFVGVYMGIGDAKHSMNHTKQQKEPYIKMQVLCQNTAKLYRPWGRPNSNDPDLVIPERLIRRYQILEPTYSSPILPLEEPSELEALAS